MDNDPNTLVINEIYPSIQGESSYAGLPCVFVRLTGCNLRCSYCDTEYAFYEGNRQTVDEVVAQTVSYKIPLIEITGGEPLLQRGCATLARKLLESGHRVLVETSGTFPIDVLPQGTIRIMDLKCPSSGESDKNDWSNIDRLNAHDEVKFVIGDRPDYEWTRDVMHRYDLSKRCTVLLSVVFAKIEPVTVTEWMLEDRLDARFQLQMHKYIWDPKKRGV